MQRFSGSIFVPLHDLGGNKNHPASDDFLEKKKLIQYGKQERKTDECPPAQVRPGQVYVYGFHRCFCIFRQRVSCFCIGLIEQCEHLLFFVAKM